MKKLFAVLAGDMVSAQRDGLVYANLIERLKNSPTDATADDVVDQMITLGFASASWPVEVGGPPPRRSLRPWRDVLDWLQRQLARVTRFLFDCAERAMVRLGGLGVESVSVGISWAPDVSFAFSSDTTRWQDLREYFLNGMLAELEQEMFSS